jgi:hypothetical protein
MRRLDFGYARAGITIGRINALLAYLVQRRSSEVQAGNGTGLSRYQSGAWVLGRPDQKGQPRGRFPARRLFEGLWCDKPVGMRVLRERERRALSGCYRI